MFGAVLPSFSEPFLPPPSSLFLSCMCQSSLSVCVRMWIFDCASMCQHCTSRCVSVFEQENTFFSFFSEKVEGKKGISEEPNQPITKQIIRLGGLRGVRQGCYYTGKKKFFFWIATQRPITIHKQTKTTLYTNDPVWVCVCVWKDGKK